MQPLRGPPFTEIQLGLHIPQLKTQTASRPGKPLKSQRHIPLLSPFCVCVEHFVGTLLNLSEYIGILKYKRTSFLFIFAPL